MNAQLKLKQVKRVAGWSAFALIVITQWEVRPWALFAELFFVAALTWQALDCYFRFRPQNIVIIAGGILNTIALTVNGGRMPVLGRTDTARWWKPLTEQSRLQFLCDVLWAGFSIGDLIIVTGILIGIVSYVYRAITKPEIPSNAASYGD